MLWRGQLGVMMTPQTWHKTRLCHSKSPDFGTICKATERQDFDAFANTLTTHLDL